MTAEAIRNTPVTCPRRGRHVDDLTCEMRTETNLFLRELTAQLADLNQILRESAAAVLPLERK